MFKVLLLVYHTFNKSAPDYLQSILTLHIPTRTLRSTNFHTLQVPRVRHSWGERAFSHMGPKLWNNLPITLRQNPSLESFKSELKSHLFNLTWILVYVYVSVILLYVYVYICTAPRASFWWNARFISIHYYYYLLYSH